ncbi:hypothetical protein [Stenotrophomonas phage BUCT603B1]|nr:hypothetical protein [Stenotrophomonas phage BUCT603B1]
MKPRVYFEPGLGWLWRGHPDDRRTVHMVVDFCNDLDRLNPNPRTR